MDPNEILSTLETLRDRLREFGVCRIGLFGSAARRKARPDSDLDFVVEFAAGKKSFDTYMDLKFFLEETFSRPVDLVLKNAIKPRLRRGILEEAIYAPGS